MNVMSLIEQCVVYTYDYFNNNNYCKSDFSSLWWLHVKNGCHIYKTYLMQVTLLFKIRNPPYFNHM